MSQKTKITPKTISFFFLLLSMIGLLALGWSDVTRGFRFDAEHLKQDSPPILFIGLAYIAYQLSACLAWRQRLNGMLLGGAFAIWGSEAYLPATGWTTVLDDLAMSVFVIDLGLIIIGARNDASADASANESNKS